MHRLRTWLLAYVGPLVVMFYVATSGIGGKLESLLLAAGAAYVVYRLARIIVDKFVDPPTKQQVHPQSDQSGSRSLPQNSSPKSDIPAEQGVDAEVRETESSNGMPPDAGYPMTGGVIAEQNKVLSLQEARSFRRAINAAISHLGDALIIVGSCEEPRPHLSGLVSDAQSKLSAVIEHETLYADDPPECSAYVSNITARIDPIADFGVWACFHNANEIVKNWRSGVDSITSLVPVEQEVRDARKRAQAARRSTLHFEEDIPEPTVPLSPAEIERLRGALIATSDHVKSSLKGAKAAHFATVVTRIEALQRRHAGARRRKLIDESLIREIWRDAKLIADDLDPIADVDIWYGLAETADILRDALESEIFGNSRA